MAEPPILTLTDVALTFGGNPLFAGVSLAVVPGDRLALVGRNGSGKSTLMRLMAGAVEPDAGSRFLRPGTRVALMEQDPDLSGCATLMDHVAHGLPEEGRHLAERAVEGLGFDATRPPSEASGGERRRAALARLIAADADLMLLDEPTNHLDIAAITWLEDYLRTSRAAFVLISHDRAFLSALSRATLWLDRGEMRRLDRGFAEFEAWRDKTWDEEDAARHKLDRLIAAEGRWAVEGISARRKRNMGRVRRLGELRAERAAAIRRTGPARLALEAGDKSGRRVIEAKGLAKGFGTRGIVAGLDITLARGDRLAIIGPNGAGKTTLVNLLTGQLEPDAGSVRLGTNLTMAVFDQNRAALDPEASLWESLTHDPALGAGRSDQVMVRGRPRHVVGYLKDFLFSEVQARGPVRALSGGEKARLLLARLFARESNLLVLDEPTNDLDIETLDLLEELLAEYEGTAIVVSHDRDFVDRVATQTVVMEGNGKAVLYAGGYSDWLAQRPAGSANVPASARPAAKPARAEPRKASARPPGLTFTQAHRLEALPAEIARLEAEIAKLSTLLSDADLYTREPVKAGKAAAALTERQAALAAAEEEWLTLEEKAEG